MIDDALPRDTPPAGFRRRTLAHLLDWIGFAVTAAVAHATWGLLAGAAPGPRASVIGLFVLHGAWHVATTAAPMQASPAKYLLGLRVVRADHERCRPGRALARHLAALPSLLLLGAGFLLAATNPERRTLHDLLAGTAVVVPAASGEDRRETAADTVIAGVLFAVVIAIAVGLWAALTGDGARRVANWLANAWMVGASASSHPGARALAPLGCDSLVLPVGRAWRLLSPFAHGGPAPDTAQSPYVVCRLGREAKAVDCPEVAWTFGRAMTPPPAQVLISVRRRGEGATCSGWFAADGTRLGGVGARGEILLDR